MNEKIVLAGNRQYIMDYIDLLAMTERQMWAENRGWSGWEDRYEEDEKYD